MNNMPWVVTTESDGTDWRFENIVKALDFYNDVIKAGEGANFPKFSPTALGGAR